MKFVLDESVDAPIAFRLTKDGHRVICVWESSRSASDTQVLSLANKNRAILITADRDFGELVFRLEKAHYGVILIRLSGLPIKEKVEIMSRVIAEHGEKLSESFTVVKPGLIRIRVGS